MPFEGGFVGFLTLSFDSGIQLVVTLCAAVFGVFAIVGNVMSRAANVSTEYREGARGYAKFWFSTSQFIAGVGTIIASVDRSGTVDFLDMLLHYASLVLIVMIVMGLLYYATRNVAEA